MADKKYGKFSEWWILAAFDIGVGLGRTLGQAASSDEPIQKPYVQKALTFDEKRYIAMSVVVLAIWLLAMVRPSWL